MGGGVALELGKRGAASRVTAFSPIGFWHRPGQVWCQGMLTVLRGTAGAAAPVVERLLGPHATRALLIGGLVGRPTKVPAAVAVDDVRALVAATSFAGARHEFAGYRFTGSPGVPTTIAWGTRDVVLTHRTQSARARVALPQARHVDLPGCGHLPFSDDPGLCADVVLSS